MEVGVRDDPELAPAADSDRDRRRSQVGRRHDDRISTKHLVEYRKKGKVRIATRAGA
jgi:hypothetical protein